MSQWSCSKCTYKNAVAMQKCEICGIPINPAEDPPLQPVVEEVFEDEKEQPVVAEVPDDEEEQPKCSKCGKTGPLGVCVNAFEIVCNRHGRRRDWFPLYIGGEEVVLGPLMDVFAMKTVLEIRMRTPNKLNTGFLYTLAYFLKMVDALTLSIASNAGVSQFDCNTGNSIEKLAEALRGRPTSKGINAVLVGKVMEAYSALNLLGEKPINIVQPEESKDEGVEQPVEVKGEVVENPGWKCKKCTFVNSEFLQVCEMCGDQCTS